MAYLQLPVVNHVKDYLISNFGPEPIKLNEGNEYYWLLVKDYDFEYKTLGKSYTDTIQLEVPHEIHVRNSHIVAFSSFAKQRLLHLVLYNHVIRPAGKKREIILDVIAEQNLDPDAFESLRSFYHRLIQTIKNG